MNKKKKVLIVSAVICVIAAAAIIILLLVNKKDSYRIIKVYEIEGEATVKRQGKGDIQVYNNMLLQSGDTISLKQGTMTLKLDDDKYVYVEENTEFELIASGSSANSKTKINLKSGAITNEITNKLSDDSAYEINTPNSTMAVRGTIFRVEIYTDDDMVTYTKISVFDGKVDTWLVYQDGSVAESSVSVSRGRETIIYEDDKNTDYLGEPEEIDYSALPEQAIQTLIKICESGSDIGVTPDELKQYLKENGNGSAEAEGDGEQKGSCVVTFVYRGTVFGTQTVDYGECAQVPSLMPSDTGSWDFDFGTPITENIDIEWK